ncbi:hypothetical protein ACLKA7_001443 [Drosophila subpalustris]
MGQLSTYQIVALIICITAYIINASPLPQPADNQELDVLHIPLTNGKEIDVLTLGSKDQEQLIADRNKRTIGLLRELFPDITKEIDSIVNRIIAQVIRVAGPGLLNSILSENRGGAGGGSTTQSSSFDADFDDDSFDDDNNDVAAAAVGSPIPTPASDASSDSSSQVKIDLPTFAPEPETSSSSANKVSARKSETNVTASTSSSTTTTTTPSTTTSTSPSPSPSIPTTTTTTVTRESTKLGTEVLPRLLGIEPTTIIMTTNENTTPVQIDEQANRIISKLLRTLGPTVLRTAIQGNTANAARTTFDADFDDDDDSSVSKSNDSTGAKSSDSGSRVTIELPTFEPDDDNEIDGDEKNTTTETATRRK